MVMKRVEAGEDVFEDLQETKTDESAITPNVLSISQKSAKSKSNCHKVAMNSLKAYDTLTLRDQGAVMILYQMAKAM